MCDFLVLNDVWPSEEINSTQYCIQELLETLKAGQLRQSGRRTSHEERDVGPAAQKDS